MKNILYSILFAVITLQACDDQIYPKLPTTSEILVIDAWLNDLQGVQTITLSKSQDYFDNTAPTGTTGAIVSVSDNNGNVYNFNEVNDGSYIWSPSFIGEKMATVGNEYTLSVSYEGETYTSTTVMGRVPSMDSITFRYEATRALHQAFFLAEFWARDPQGTGDAYWIKSYKNGEFLSKPSEINIAYDAGFSKGGQFDDFVFIPPIRDGINPFDDNKKGEFQSPFVDGDSIYVEIHSISESAFDFLTQVRLQTDRPGGFAELFAQPMSNVPTNITNQDTSSDKIALGFFNVAAVVGKGKTLVENDVARD